MNQEAQPIRYGMFIMPFHPPTKPLAQCCDEDLELVVAAEHNLPVKIVLLNNGVHGMVRQPMIFTMDDLMRFPSISRIHFLECSGNGSREWRTPFAKSVQVSHGLLSCCEWTGVALSTILEEAGVHDVLAKSLGSPNAINVARATINGLRELQRPDEVAKRRGIPADSFVPKGLLRAFNERKKSSGGAH